MSKGLLQDLERMLEGMLAPQLPDAKYQAPADDLGQRMGFCAMMGAAAAGWAKNPRAAGTNRVVGPTVAQVNAMLARIRSEL